MLNGRYVKYTASVFVSTSGIRIVLLGQRDAHEDSADDHRLRHRRGLNPAPCDETTAMSCLIAVMLAACAPPGPADLKTGASADEIKAQMGTPVATHTLPNGDKRLEFSGRGAMTYMLDVDASGRLVKWTQVLTEANFRNIVPGMARKQVLMTLGQPAMSP